MNAELRELYQEVVIDHCRHPKNFGELADFTHKLEGYNPLCGDRLTLYLQVEDGLIRDLKFQGVGCAISMASASLMTERLKGKPIAEAMQLFAEFHELMLTGATDKEELMGKLMILSGVNEFPTRVKCATLAWHTLKGALYGERRSVSTE